MSSWLDEDYNVDEIFDKNVQIDEESRITSAAQPKPAPVESKKMKEKQKLKEMEEKMKLKEVEDFMGLDSPETNSVVSKPSDQTTAVVKSEKSELKARILVASTIDDFMRLSQEISDIINIARESEHYVKFLIDINRKCAKDLYPDDIRNLSGNLNSLNRSNDKKKKSKLPSLKTGPAKKGNRSEVTAYDDYALADEGQADDYDSTEEEYLRKLK